MKRVLFISLLVAISAGGWFAYAQNQDKTTEGEQAQTIQMTEKDPSEGGKYLVLEAYKVRIPLSADLKDLKLGEVMPSNYSAEDRYITILAPELDTTWKCSSDPSQAKAIIGSISVTKEVRRAGPYEPVASKKIGDLTYGYEPGGSNCTSDPKHQQLSAAFESQFQSMEAY